MGERENGGRRRSRTRPRTAPGFRDRYPDHPGSRLPYLAEGGRIERPRGKPRLPVSNRAHCHSGNLPWASLDSNPELSASKAAPSTSWGRRASWWVRMEFAPSQPRRGIYSPLGSLVPSRPENKKPRSLGPGLQKRLNAPWPYGIYPLRYKDEDDRRFMTIILSQIVAEVKSKIEGRGVDPAPGRSA